MNVKSRLTLARIYEILLRHLPDSFKITGPMKQFLKGLARGMWDVQQEAQPDVVVPLRYANEVISIDKASDTQGGYLSKEDYLALRVRTVRFTVGTSDRTDVNYAFAANADLVAQAIGTLVLPATARLLSARMRSLIAPVGGTVSLALGNGAAPAAYLPSTDLTALDSAVELTAYPPATELVQRTLLVTGTPGVAWNTLTSGKWGVVVSYILQDF